MDEFTPEQVEAWVAEWVSFCEARSIPVTAQIIEVFREAAPQQLQVMRAARARWRELRRIYPEPLVEAIREAMLESHDRAGLPDDLTVPMLIENGHHPTDPEIAEYLREVAGGEIPSEVALYLAGRWDRSIRRTKPRQRWTDKVADGVKAAYLGRRVLRWKRVFRERYKMASGKPGSTDPYLAALDKVSEEFDIPTSTLDKYVYPRSD